MLHLEACHLDHLHFQCSVLLISIQKTEKNHCLFTYSRYLLITFANSLDPDHVGQNVGPDLDSNCLTLWVFLKDFLEKVDFEKNQQTTKKHENYPAVKELILYYIPNFNHI